MNLRPARLLPGVHSPLGGVAPEDVDIVFVRENTEGEYAGAGGRVHGGHPTELAVETSVFTRDGIERIVRYAFEHARDHGRRHVTSATKSNALRHGMPLWDDVFDEVAAEFPQITTDSCLIDALVARMVRDPASLDVVVGSNLFGDILTDLGAAIAGSLGIAPSANLDPTRRNPSLFQAIHGSAPDIAGRGIANPVAEIWSAAMLLDFLGETRRRRRAARRGRGDDRRPCDLHARPGRHRRRPPRRARRSAPRWASRSRRRRAAARPTRAGSGRSRPR